jgi:sialate O-acetylesterase
MSLSLRLGLPFVDHLVLQQGRTNSLWGWDRPGERVTLRIEGLGFEAHAHADATGAFEIACPPLPPGGPYRLLVEGSDQVVLDDVASGEVWLASGQSNMEWPVRASADADAEIAGADDPMLRVIKIGNHAAWEPCDHGSGSWQPTRPESVGVFTAVGYSFARHLREHLRVPVGIIDCTWGGTPIAAWMSLPALRTVLPDVDRELQRLRDQRAELPRMKEEYARVLSSWEQQAFPADPPNLAETTGFARVDFDDQSWHTLRLPAFWQHHGMRFNGVVWFRREVVVPEDWGGRPLALSLGAIDDFDHTYWNGELVGSHPAGTPGAFQIPRHYVVPGRLVRPGRNVVAVRVFDHFGEGGFVGPAAALSVAPEGESASAISLAGPWRLFPEFPIPLVPNSVWSSYPKPPLLLTPQHMPGALHHGMVAPLRNFGLRGFLWYQGESDVEQHAEYARRQVALVRDLRARFGQSAAPFLFVELAGYRGGANWPLLREAQQQAATEPHTALVTARDIGDPDNIHPRNKQEVGRRLALLARSRVYGHDVVAHGPSVERLELSQGVVRVWFAHAGGLRARDAEHPLGFELAGSDGRFHRAEARIVDEHVELRAAQVPAPAAVRYAFTDTGDGDLENAAGLPALSFRADVPAGS